MHRYRHLCLQVKGVLPPVQFLFVLSLSVFVRDTFAERGAERDVGWRWSCVVTMLKPVGEALVCVLQSPQIITP